MALNIQWNFPQVADFSGILKSNLENKQKAYDELARNLGSSIQTTHDYLLDRELANLIENYDGQANKEDLENQIAANRARRIKKDESPLIQWRWQNERMDAKNNAIQQRNNADAEARKTTEESLATSDQEIRDTLHEIRMARGKNDGDSVREQMYILEKQIEARNKIADILGKPHFEIPKEIIEQKVDPSVETARSISYQLNDPNLTMERKGQLYAEAMNLPEGSVKENLIAKFPTIRTIDEQRIQANQSNSINRQIQRNNARDDANKLTFSELMSKSSWTQDEMNALMGKHKSRLDGDALKYGKMSPDEKKYWKDNNKNEWSLLKDKGMI